MVCFFIVCIERENKVIFVKLPAMLALLALVMAPVFAYDVGIIVTVSQDTLAVGTNITIVKDGTLLYNTRADANGAAMFKLDAGSYFVYLDRGGYSRHVNLLEVGKTENITYTMRQLISYASAYGQVAGPTDFGNSSVAAYANGNVVKRATPNKDGYYLMSFMPEGQYEMVFSAQGFVEKREAATLLQSQFSEVNAQLDKVPLAPVAQPTMSVPSAAQRQSVIEILVLRGSLPLSGQVVGVKTPSGSVEVITGADGKAHVNAVAAGEYIFTYGNLTSKTMVEGGAVAPAPVPNATEPEPIVPSPPAEQSPAASGLVAGAAAIVIAGAIVVLGIVIFVASRMAKQEPKGPEKPEHKHPHAHKHGQKK